jgi:hypothetical protein
MMSRVGSLDALASPPRADQNEGMFGNKPLGDSRLILPSMGHVPDVKLSRAQADLEKTKARCVQTWDLVLSQLCTR